MQGVSKHFYKFLTPHRLCQPKLELARTYVFTYPNTKKFAKSVMLYERNTREGRLVKNPSLDVYDSSSVVLKKALIVFKFGSPVKAYSYTSFYDPTNIVKISLPDLPFNDQLEYFSVCKLANNTKVILSGGEVKGKKSA